MDAVNLPGQDDRVVFGDVGVAAQVFIGMAARMVVVWYERECPPGQDVFAAGDR